MLHRVEFGLLVLCRQVVAAGIHAGGLLFHDKGRVHGYPLMLRRVEPFHQPFVRHAEVVDHTESLLQVESEVQAKVVAKSGHLDNQPEAVLFIDRVHSSPFIEPKEKSRVTFRGREYEVHQVKALYAFGLHHYEVVLV